MCVWSQGPAMLGFMSHGVFAEVTYDLSTADIREHDILPAPSRRSSSHKEFSLQ